MACNPMSEEYPKVFISYSWDDDLHKAWVKAFATRLRTEDGVDVTLDQWATVPGDQLPKFMEQAIRENSYVLLICTPKYKQKSDNREGGVGYEGDIMTGEVFANRNHSKFIPVLRKGEFKTDVPTWLNGKYGIDLSKEPYAEDQYLDLIATLFKRREQAPLLGKPKAAPFKSVREEAQQFFPTKEPAAEEFEPIKITQIMVDEVGEAKNDGSRGSALYAIPFKLSRKPTHEWGALFIRNWDHPPSYTNSHRPGTACVNGDRIILIRTTIEEVENTHRKTLKLAVDETNKQIAEIVRRRNAEEQAQKQARDVERERIRRTAEGMDFS